VALKIRMIGYELMEEISDHAILGLDLLTTGTHHISSSTEEEDLDRHFIAPAIGLEADAYRRLGMRPAR